jgi:hypothetical protein
MEQNNQRPKVSRMLKIDANNNQPRVKKLASKEVKGQGNKPVATGQKQARV